MLGTSLDLQVIAGTGEAGRAAEKAVLREIDRLESVFSAYRPDSELRRFEQTQGTAESVSPDLAEALIHAEAWRGRTNGAFHPAAEALTRLWRAAAETGAEPDPETLAQTVQAMQQPGPLWEVGDPEKAAAIRRTALPVTLNALAKGLILDRACERARAVPDVRTVLVNIGGDIRHGGETAAPVGISDPFAPQENAPLLDTVCVKDQGIATSGNYRRGFTIGDRRHGHLIDPRTGYPVENVVSASVIAPSAMVADVLATAFSVLPPDESLRLADDLPHVGVLIVSRDGTRRENALWRGSRPS